MMAHRALRLLAALVARLPLRWLSPLGAAVGWVAGSVLRIRRSQVEAAMLRAGVRCPPAAAARMYRGLGHGVAELLWLAGASAEGRARAIEAMTFDDAAELECAIERGPVIVFASHTGNWELAAAAAAALLARRGKRLVVIAKAMRVRGVDAFVARLRANLGVLTLPPNGALASARRALDAGDVVVMPIDQVPDRAAHGTPLSFLGEVALVDRAPATLAFRARATVLVVAAERVGSRSLLQHRARILEAILPPSADATADRWIGETTARATARLESFVEGAPESWLWLHRRWRLPASHRAPRGAKSPDAGRLVAKREAG